MLSVYALNSRSNLFNRATKLAGSSKLSRQLPMPPDQTTTYLTQRSDLHLTHHLILQPMDVLGCSKIGFDGGNS